MSLVDDPHYLEKQLSEIGAGASPEETPQPSTEKKKVVDEKTTSEPKGGLVDDPDYLAKELGKIPTEGQEKEKAKKPEGDWVDQGIDRVVDKIASVFPIKAKKEVATADAADVLGDFAKGKTNEEFINGGGQELANQLNPEQSKRFFEQNQHILPTREQFNKAYEYSRSQPISISKEDIAQAGEGLKATVKNLAKGAYHVGRDILSTDPNSNALLWNDIKSYASPVFEAVPDVAWTVAKVKNGGTRLSDIVAEKFGQSPEQSQENAYQRRLIDTAKAQADQASKNNIYSFYATSPTFISGIKAKLRLNSPDADDATLQQQAEKISQQIADEQKPLDTAIADLARFTLPYGAGMGGDMAVLMNAAPFARGLAAAAGKALPKSFQETRIAAQQAANEARLAKQVESAGKVSAFGKVAAGTAKTIENLQEASEKFAEAHPNLANIGSAVAKYGPGAYVGYESNEQNPLLGAVIGAGIEKAGLAGLAGLKAGEALKNLPRVAADVAEARAASAGGRLGRFEAAGLRPESSELTQKIFGGGRGAKIDAIGNYLMDHGREGVNMTALGLATGAINSDNSDQMRDMVENGLIYGFLGKTVHKALGTDPVDIARKVHAQDVDNYKTLMTMSPETRNHLRPFTDWGTVVEQAQANLAKVQQNGGDVTGAQKVLNHVQNANLATREAYRREVLNSLTRANQVINGSLRAGQPNIGIEILTGKQIFDKLAEQNPNRSAAELQAMADSSKGIYFPSGAREISAGANIPEALKASGEGTTFNPLKPTVVVNLDNVLGYSMSQGKSLNEALSHELGHAIQDIPEFRDLNKDVYQKLFDIEFKGPDGKTYHSTKGLYSDKDLVKMFFDNYLSADEFSTKQDKEAWAESRGFMRDGKPDEAKIANYMKDEVMADLNGTAFHLGRTEKLDSGRQHLLDWAATEQQNNLVARAVNKLMGYGGDGRVGNEPKAFTGAKFTPEILAAHRNAIREMAKLNGMVSTPARGEVAKAAVSKAQLLKSKALMERYGKDSGLFKTEFKATIFDKDGNAVGTTTLRDPMTKEGTWGEQDGQVSQRSGYGEYPQELANVQVPPGGTVKVSREIVIGPDGETPQMLSAKEAQQLSATRDQLIRNAIDGTDDVGTPGRFQPFSADGLSYSGTFTPKQIEAIRSLPESVVPAKIKDTILRFNKLISEGQGNRMLIDYAARLDERGKYKAFSPKIYDVVPIGMGFSKAGNFYVTAVSVTRLLNKLELWSDRMPSRLNLWGGDREAFFREFANTYLPNHLAGKPGETGLSKDPAVAIQKKNIFNDFLNLTRNDAVMNNPDRTTVPRKKGEKKKDFDPDRTIMAIRADAVADMLESTNTPLPIDYGNQLANFLPAGEKSAEQRRIEEEIKNTERSISDYEDSRMWQDAAEERNYLRQLHQQLRDLQTAPEAAKPVVEKPTTQQNLPGFLAAKPITGSLVDEASLKKLDALGDKNSTQVDADTRPYKVNPNPDSVALPPRWSFVNRNIVGMPRSFKEVTDILDRAVARLKYVAAQKPNFAKESARFYRDMAESAMKMADGINPSAKGLDKWLLAELNMRFLALGSPRTAVAANATKSSGSAAAVPSNFEAGYKIGFGDQSKGSRDTYKAWQKGQHFDLNLPGVQDKVRSFYINGLSELIEMAEEAGDTEAAEELRQRAGKSLRVLNAEHTDKLTPEQNQDIQRLLDGKATIDMWDMAAKGFAWPGYLLNKAKRNNVKQPFQWSQDKFAKDSTIDSKAGQQVLKELGYTNWSDLRYQEARALRLDGNPDWNQQTWEERKTQPFAPGTKFTYFTEGTEAGLTPGGGGPLYDAQQGINGLLADKLNELGMAGMFGKTKLKARNAQEILWALEKLDNPVKANNDLSLFGATFDPFLQEIEKLRQGQPLDKKSRGANVLAAMDRAYNQMARQVMPLEVVTQGTSPQAERVQGAIAALEEAGDKDAVQTITYHVANGLHDKINELATKHNLDVTVDSVDVGKGGYTEGDQVNVAPNMRMILRGSPEDTKMVLEALSRSLDQDGGNIIRKPTVRELNDANIKKNFILTLGTGHLDKAARDKMFLDLAALKDAEGSSFLTGFTETDQGVAIGDQFYGGNMEEALKLNQDAFAKIIQDYGIKDYELAKGIVDMFFRGQEETAASRGDFQTELDQHIASRLASKPGRGVQFPQVTDAAELWSQRADDLFRKLPTLSSKTKQNEAKIKLKSDLEAAVLRGVIDEQTSDQLKAKYGFKETKTKADEETE